MRYRKKPVEVDAIQWTGDNVQEVLEFLGDDYIGHTAERHINGNSLIYVQSREGRVEGRRGCMIMRGVEGEHYVCDINIFNKTYEKVI